MIEKQVLVYLGLVVLWAASCWGAFYAGCRFGVKGIELGLKSKLSTSEYKRVLQALREASRRR